MACKTVDDSSLSNDPYRQQLEMTLASNASWEDYLSPAPMTIALFGQLMVVSSNHDFAIDQNAPKGGYKHIKYPKSFRASLMQVANSARNVFNVGHTSMDKIKQFSAMLPTTLTNVVKILNNDAKLIKLFMPIQLRKLEDITKSCLDQAKHAEELFTSLRDLTSELMEACCASKGKYEKDVTLSTQALEILNMKDKAVHDEKKIIEESMGALQKEFHEAMQFHKDAIKNLPSGWNIKDLTDALIDGVKGSYNQIMSTVYNGPQSETNATGSQSTPHCDNRYYEGSVYTKADFLYKLINKLVSVENSESEGNQNPQCSCEYIKRELDKIVVALHAEKDCDPKQRAIEICNLGIQLCSEMVDDKKPLDPMQMQNLAKMATEFYESKEEAKTSAGTPEQTLPNSEHSNGSKSGRLQLEYSEKLLQMTQTWKTHAHEKMIKNNEEVFRIIEDIGKHKMEKIDFETTKEILAKGLEAISQIQEQWTKLVQFF
ncbi:uncharacterized protein LOC133340039 [Lethenteron reissneri]|uniref:uncharacterized protein LOC133340039 n=1 Tax=Lethenteron reissneri TaxID=7753 RepID=UPI002AB5E148|nr:uncharacterized protein LOC133340039 [Lethenteron reissneri]